MGNDLKRIRKFVAERLSKFGLKLHETYDDHAKADVAWRLMVFSPGAHDKILFISDTGFQTDVCGDEVTAESQDELWNTALFAFLVKSKETTYVKYREIMIADDGIVECRVKTELLFGVDVSDCTSWKEVMLKCAISEG